MRQVREFASPGRVLADTSARALKRRQLGSRVGRLRYCGYEEGFMRLRLMDRRSACRASVVLTVSILAAVVFGAAASPAAAVPTCHGITATIVGTRGPDQILGTPGDDVIVARGGADQIQGLAGNDLICAGRDADQVDGNGGGDTIFGGRGGDQLSGGRGGDTDFGGRGGDQLFGNRGSDGLAGGAGFDLGSGGPEIDLCRSVELARSCE
jgi:hypothetical protein